MEPNKLELEIKKKLDSRTIQPSALAWDRLEAMLDNAEKTKGVRSRPWLYIAASIVGLLFLATIFFQNFETNTTLKNVPFVLEQKGNTAPHKKPEVINEQIVPTTSGNNNSLVNQVAATKVYQNTTVIKEKNTVAVVLTTNPQNDKQNVVITSGDKTSPIASRNKYISAADLLADVSNIKLETTTAERSLNMPQQGYKVNPNSLLSSAETELNQSFRESALIKLSKNFNSIKTVLVNRNYVE